LTKKLPALRLVLFSRKEAHMKVSRSLASVFMLILVLHPQRLLAEWDDYDDSQSNPLRVAAYLLYPVGFVAEWIVFRPFHFLVSATEPQEAFFGHRPHPPILAEPQTPDYGLPKTAPQKPAAPAPTPAPAQPQAAAPTPQETVKIVEVPVEKVVVKEVPKIVEVEKMVFPTVAFRFDSAELTDLGKGQVYLAAQRLKQAGDLTLVIEGHTDVAGSEEYNQKLGRRRAETVIKELVAQGVEPNRVSAISLGESKPLIDQDTQWARAVNRRVELQVKGAR
jgi:outer membrane protein OmpA-like peptidoglycan-associated protein